ncbi:hypothetical protein M2110_005130 [Paenibacillus sp. PastF-4]|nr:hypothetical protein [Paenibacillus sp. PastF-4]MDH6446554.1 hypothetical protein [Paenibacillus sp. PastF-4]
MLSESMPDAIGRYRTQMTLNAGLSAIWDVIGLHSSYWHKKCQM